MKDPVLRFTSSHILPQNISPLTRNGVFEFNFGALQSIVVLSTSKYVAHLGHMAASIPVFDISLLVSPPKGFVQNDDTALKLVSIEMITTTLK